MDDTSTTPHERDFDVLNELRTNPDSNHGYDQLLCLRALQARLEERLPDDLLGVDGRTIKIRDSAYLGTLIADARRFMGVSR